MTGQEVERMREYLCSLPPEKLGELIKKEVETLAARVVERRESGETGAGK